MFCRAMHVFTTPHTFFLCLLLLLRLLWLWLSSSEITSLQVCGTFMAMVKAGVFFWTFWERESGRLSHFITMQFVAFARYTTRYKIYYFHGSHCTHNILLVVNTDMDKYLCWLGYTATRFAAWLKRYNNEMHRLSY